MGHNCAVCDNENIDVYGNLCFVVDTVRGGAARRVVHSDVCADGAADTGRPYVLGSRALVLARRPLLLRRPIPATWHASGLVPIAQPLDRVTLRSLKQSFQLLIQTRHYISIYLESHAQEEESERK
ncbi:hypothetical protein EVAR_86363_1 [Eumeta japonica]|uniref:Uncharacterized protein n=1 Tax=Eumeta variegata TaxID=151549 RepID=A0A4C1YEU0_EUMVA|nr:hypothetical protein EVAR_86363_1 [Eumeta japonica]